MSRRAKLAVYDQRHSRRFGVNYEAIAEHRALGDIKVNIINLSANGFMTEGDLPLGKGERISVRLPVVGVIEAHLVWVMGSRAGFQLERIIRPNEFDGMIDGLAGKLINRAH